MTARPPARSAVLAVLTAIALVAGVGCAPERDPEWRPPAWSSSELTVIDAPAPLDPSAVPNLVGARVRNDSVGVQARWMRPSGDTALGDAAEGIVRDAIRARTAETHVAYAPAVFPVGTGLGERACIPGSTRLPAGDVLADPALGPAGGAGTAVVCDLVTASGTVIGQRMRVVAGSADAVQSDVAVLLYADTATDTVRTADELWGPDAAATLWTAIVEERRRAHGAVSLVAVQPPGPEAVALLAAALRDTVLLPDGSLTITVPAGLTAPELENLGLPPTTEPLTVGVPAEVAAPLLSTDGTALAAAAIGSFSPPAMVGAGFETVPCDLFPCVAVTYDDGPGEGTPAILDAAWAHHASVSLFVMGQKTASGAPVLARALAEGNLVENHTWSHPHLPDITRAEMATQLGDTTAAIGLAIGKAPTVFRPPYGDYDAEVLAVAGMAAILWDVDTFDWQGPGDEELIRRAVAEPRPGSIVLQHDIQPNTVRTAGAVYAGLADRGFTLVNLEQLFGGSLPTKGVWRSGR